MNICSIQKISKNFAGNPILNDITFDINDKDLIGIVGRNGSGKTTLFKLLSGIEQPDSGSIYMRKGLSIGYLEQLPSFPDQSSVLDVLQQAFASLYQLEAKMKELELRLTVEKNEKELKRLLNEYGSIQDKFIISGGYEIESEIAKIVNGLGISNMLNQRFVSLSGGEKTKVSLGYILLTKPDILLLDEPTNHLDISSVEWLEQYLKQYEGTIIIISHDRYFLDMIVTKIYDIDNGDLTVYHGNYSAFVKEKEERLIAEFAAYQDQQKKIKKMKEAIKRLKEWANRANPPNEGLHRRAANMEKALERMDKLKKPNINPRKIDINFDLNERSGKDVITIENLTKSFADLKLFSNLNFNVRYGEQVSIIGNNGTGKSTLIKMILGIESYDGGIVQIGSNVKIGYLSQNVMDDYEDYTVIDSFRDKVPVTEERARNILAKFLFYGNNVFKHVKNLSGGEKTRLKLAQIMHQDINMLILDEPTNHLDIDSREELEEALSEFAGSIICISHDRYLLNKLFNTTYWLEGGKLDKYEGNYNYAKQKKESFSEIKTNTNNTSKITTPVNNFTNNKIPNKSTTEEEFNKIEDEIKIIEDYIHQLEIRMLSTNDYDLLAELQKEKTILEIKREELYKKLDEILIEEI